MDEAEEVEVAAEEVLSEDKFGEGTDDIDGFKTCGSKREVKEGEGLIGA